MKKEKICMVIQRYGLEVNGGAELHCRKLSEYLLKYYDVTVLTTKSIDYIKWDNHYQKDLEFINGVRVIRFYSKDKDIDDFNEWNKRQLVGMLSFKEEIQWLEKQGPFSVELIEYIRNNKEDYKSFIFFTYLYYPTVMGIKEVYKKSILIPTVHDEPAINLSIYKEMFYKTKAIFYNTKEEKRLVESIFDNEFVMNDIGGIGIEVDQKTDMNFFKKKYNFEKYIVYIGRIDEEKGCKLLLEYFEEYKKRTKDTLNLVLIGKSNFNIPKKNYIHYLGFLSDVDKFHWISGAEAVVIPSEFESLSIVLLEAMALSKPVIVNAKSLVLTGHCLRSNAGLYFENIDEFIAVLNYMKRNKKIWELMGENGRKYVENEYDWKKIIYKLKKIIDKIT